ncbi:MAG: hypothetical protein WC379_04195 [Methanoregula sp.]
MRKTPGHHEIRALLLIADSVDIAQPDCPVRGPMGILVKIPGQGNGGRCTGTLCAEAGFMLMAATGPASRRKTRRRAQKSLMKKNL